MIAIAACSTKSALRLLGAFACFAIAAATHAQTVGNVVSTQVQADQVDFKLSQGEVARVQMLDSGLVRVRLNPSGTFLTTSSGAVLSTGLVAPGATITDLPAATYMVTSLAKVVIVKSPWQVVVYRPDGSVVTADLPGGVGWNKQTGWIYDAKYALSGEHYFGLGERGGPIDRRGRKITMMNVDSAGYGEFTDPLYISIPYFYGVRKGAAWGLFFDNAAEPSFDMDSQNKGILSFAGNNGELDYYVMTGPEPWRVANTYTRLTGYKPIPPKWTMGYHQSRYGYNSETQLLTVASTLRQKQIPCDAIYLDIDYMNQRQMFTWDPVNFPNPKVMNSWLEQLGIKRVNIMEPLLLETDPLWTTLNSSSWLLTSGGQPVVSSIWYGNVSWIDFTRTDAAAWYQSSLQSFLASGISGTWNDLNEPAENFMPQATYNFNGAPQTDPLARNTYALHEASVSYQAQSALHPTVRPWVFSRSGFAGIQRYSANWSGDTLSTFDSLRVSIEISNSMGLSGQDQFGHDIGGFLGSPSAELFLRWLEFAEFTPMFRNHAVNTAAPREPWAFGDPYTGMITDVIKQRYQLLPYLYSLYAGASWGGPPVLSPLVFHFPADSQTFTQDTEFMLGDSVLVAPVYVQGATSRSVYLPAGTNWIDFHSDQLYAGGQVITASAPLTQIPVFVRAGAILPGGPILQYVDQPVAQLPTVDFYPGADSTFTLYEDDGNTTSYLNGVYLKTRISIRQQTSPLTATLQRVEGSWIPPDRGWTLNFHGTTQAPSAVTVNGTSVQQVSTLAGLNAVLLGWYYNPINQQLAVRVHDSPVTLQIVVTP